MVFQTINKKLLELGPSLGFLYKKKTCMVSKENIDKINTTGNVLNICIISIYIFFKEGTNK